MRRDHLPYGHELRCDLPRRVNPSIRLGNGRGSLRVDERLGKRGNDNGRRHLRDGTCLRGRPKSLPYRRWLDQGRSRFGRTSRILERLKILRAFPKDLPKEKHPTHRTLARHRAITPNRHPHTQGNCTERNATKRKTVKQNPGNARDHTTRQNSPLNGPGRTRETPYGGSTQTCTGLGP